MGQILIRDVDEATLRKVKRRAKRHGHSMQKELKLLLYQALQLPVVDDTGTLFPPVIPVQVGGLPASRLLIKDRQ